MSCVLKKKGAARDHPRIEMSPAETEAEPTPLVSGDMAREG